VPAQIGGDDVPLVPERFRRPVPVPAMIPPSVKEEEGRLVRIAPVHVMEAEALGEETVRGRARHTRRQYHGLPGARMTA